MDNASDHMGAYAQITNEGKWDNKRKPRNINK